jgi:hypothetical protein
MSAARCSQEQARWKDGGPAAGWQILLDCVHPQARDCKALLLGVEVGFAYCCSPDEDVSAI